MPNLRVSPLLAAVSLTAILLPGAAGGQTIPSPFRFIEKSQSAGAFLGTLSPGTGRFGYGPGSGVLYGARYAIELSGPFSLEGTGSYFPTTRALIDPGRDEGDRKVGEVDSRLVILDARVKFSLTGDRTWHRLSPYAAAGGGVAFDVAPTNEDRESLLLEQDRFSFGTSFVGVMGAGLRWFPSQRITVRMDVDLLIWRVKTPAGFLDPTRGFEGVGEREWVSGPSLSLGAAVRF